MKPRFRIMRLLSAANVPLSGAEISGTTCVTSAELYPILANLETDGLIESVWDEASEPRRRLYNATHDGPTPEQQVEHLAEQCATVLAENEDLRIAVVERDRLRDALKVHWNFIRFVYLWTNREDVTDAERVSVIKGHPSLRKWMEGDNPLTQNEPLYDEITDELMATVHDLLGIIRGIDRSKTIESVQRAHKLLLRLHSLSFPVAPDRSPPAAITPCHPKGE